MNWHKDTEIFDSTTRSESNFFSTTRSESKKNTNKKKAIIIYGIIQTPRAVA